MSKKYSQIIFANMAEAMEQITRDIPIDNKKLSKIREELSLSDRVIFWEGDNKILITPHQMSVSLLEKNKENLGFSNIKNIYFSNDEIDISKRLLNDKEVFNKIIEIIRDNPGINLSPYSLTESFRKLVYELNKLDLKFNTYEKPIQSAEWLISYLDSKVGSRTEINKIKSSFVKIPESYIGKDIEEAIRIATWLWTTNRSCIIKTNFGESGWGLIMLKKNNYKSVEDIKNKVTQEINIDPIWKNKPLIIEEYIIPTKNDYNSPSSELYLTDKDVKLTYVCNQIISKNGEFIGITIGKNLMEKSLKNRIVNASLQIGKRFWELGYRGFFDIDFIVSKNKVPFAIETNMRRTGGTHVYDAVKTIFGKDWEKRCFCISNNHFVYSGLILSADKILEKLKDLLYPINNEKRGIIITLVDKYKPAFGFIVVSTNKESSIELYNKMFNRLTQKTKSNIIT